MVKTLGAVIVQRRGSSLKTDAFQVRSGYRDPMKGNAHPMMANAHMTQSFDLDSFGLDLDFVSACCFPGLEALSWGFSSCGPFNSAGQNQLLPARRTNTSPLSCSFGLSSGAWFPGSLGSPKAEAGGLEPKALPGSLIFATIIDLKLSRSVTYESSKPVGQHGDVLTLLVLKGKCLEARLGWL